MRDQEYINKTLGIMQRVSVQFTRAGDFVSIHSGDELLAHLPISQFNEMTANEILAHIGVDTDD